MARRYAKGKKSQAICQRGGHQIPYRYLVVEPGTGLWVDRRWSDGKWNSVDHAQNFPATNLEDELPLKLATGTDTAYLSVGTTVVYVNGFPFEQIKTSAITTCVNLTNELNQPLLTETSVTIFDCFNQNFFNSFHVV